MKRDSLSLIRSDAREAWEDRRPPPNGTNDEPSAEVRAPATRNRPEHLVVTNGAADRARTLLGVAGFFAERAGATLRVVHHYAPVSKRDNDENRRFSPTHHGGPLARICDRLVRSARSLSGTTGLPVSPELVIDPIEPMLTEYVRVNEFELVTARGDSSWLPVHPGGAVAEIARQRPVLLVGPGVAEDWPAGEREPREVLVPLDGTLDAEDAIAPAVALCRLLDARLTLLSVTRRNERAPRHTQRYLVDVARMLHGHAPTIRTILMSPPLTEAVLTVQHATGAVVSLAAPVRSWFSVMRTARLGRRILRESTAPVLFHRPGL